MSVGAEKCSFSHASQIGSITPKSLKELAFSCSSASGASACGVACAVSSLDMILPVTYRLQDCFQQIFFGFATSTTSKMLEEKCPDVWRRVASTHVTQSLEWSARDKRPSAFVRASLRHGETQNRARDDLDFRVIILQSWRLGISGVTMSTTSSTNGEKKSFICMLIAKKHSANRLARSATCRMKSVWRVFGRAAVLWVPWRLSRALELCHHHRQDTNLIFHPLTRPHQRHLKRHRRRSQLGLCLQKPHRHRQQHQRMRLSLQAQVAAVQRTLNSLGSLNRISRLSLLF